MESKSCESRLEILRFILACEQFLAFAQLDGGPSRLTPDDRRRILAYQKIIKALMSGQGNINEEEYKLAA
jgi:hypothetical protein